MLDTLKEFFGIDSGYDGEEEEYVEYDPQEEMNGSYPTHPQASNNQPELTKIAAPNNQTNRKEMKMNNVIGMPGLTNGNSEVVVIEPHSFEEMPQVIIALRERKSVVLNLNVMNPEEAQRAVDFIAGGTYAMDGHQERVGESIFLFTPSSVKVSSLSGILKDVHTPEAHVRRTATPAPEAWGHQPNVAAQ
ncbi:cell division protein SepF [Waterburya agarophytonicola K14]|uniref:Cell division protein SepF n=1 Tax=Waterburya agarophytonicola KI4 TaxID=2874699 RepID=A0A964BU28_9CYAN|nr:cell division protein SepF [Waterburya agarophytonicola]MCC0177875.1 cell division protein SepF [Waterburya agarophytonicola KI4]